MTPPRLAIADIDGSGDTRTLLVMASLQKGALATVKVVTVSAGQAAGLSSHLMAFDRRGNLIAVIEAHHLTALRTAAASVLAAQALGHRFARRLAVLGAGRQTRAHVDAFVDAMAIDCITVWARRVEAADDFANFCRSRVDNVDVAVTPCHAVQSADICVGATASRLPLIMGDWVRPGAHVDLVGGFRPEMREADDRLVTRATIVADTAVALDEAGDLVQPLAAGVILRDDVMLLADLLGGVPKQRRGDITLFKSVGHAAEDLVVTELLLARLGLIESAAAITENPTAFAIGTSNHAQTRSCDAS